MAMPYGPGPTAGVPAGAYGSPAMGAQRSSITPSGAQTIASLKTWMKVYGIFLIVAGGIYCLSIVGLVVGWLPILLGYWLLKAGNSFHEFAQSGQFSSLEAGMGALRNHFLTVGIMLIIWLVFVLLILVFYLIMGAAMFAGVLGSI